MSGELNPSIFQAALLEVAEATKAAAAAAQAVQAAQQQHQIRHAHGTRVHKGAEVDVDHEAKKAKLELQKKQRINQLRASHEAMIRTVQVGDDEYATMDDYSVEHALSDSMLEEELWCNEDQVQLDSVPEALWSKAPLDKTPPPERWVDELADAVEISRLVSMQVLQPLDQQPGGDMGTLTTRFVYDWRIKKHPSRADMWMRRSRFVAREFASTKRDDTYSPASSCHLSNLIPLVYLKMLDESMESGSNDAAYKVTLASLDVKDAFLQVPQPTLIVVTLYNKQYLLQRNLPGQRLGARSWYWYFREYVNEALECTWCREQPCLARCTNKGIHNVFMLHVDDLLFAGSEEFWKTKFLPAMQAKFNVNFHEIQGDGSSICFLKRKLVKTNDGLLIVPGTTVEKIVSCFEAQFGAARPQKVPADASIQNADTSQPLSAADGKAFRSVVGLLLYAGRDRIDIMFTVKELASYMANPTLCSLQRLRKLIGYLKSNGDMGMQLATPCFGKGKLKSGGEHFWLLECFSDADWSANRKHRKSTSSAIHFVNGNFCYCSSRSQRVVSLSSAESELHSLVSGCSDSIYIKRCLKFLVQEEVEHWQFTDNSAARQLVQKQGVGRIRHLSGKLLWIQDLVLQKEIQVGQVATQWNYSDIGTKPLSKARMFMLLNQVGAMDPESRTAIGQEEFEEAVAKECGHQQLKRFTKAVLRMAAVWGLEPLTSHGVDAAKFSGDGEMLRKDLNSCWAQVADEDGYIAQVEARVIQLEMTCETLKEQVTENSNELSMTHDYVSGIHYAVVESGGFLRNGLGLTHDQQLHLTTLERANMVSHCTMGSGDFMRLVRQGSGPRGSADTTDDPRTAAAAATHAEESESEEDDMEVDVEGDTTRSTGYRSLTDMLTILSREQRHCLNDGDWRDATVIQNMMLEMFEAIHSGVINDEMRGNFHRKICQMFENLQNTAISQNRWQSADRYQAMHGAFQ
eukprot:s680_g16.t1